MSEYNWTEFTKRIDINADISEIYEAWATSKGIESWFLRKSEVSDKKGIIRNENDFYQPADKYHWLWFGWADDTFEKGTIFRANGKDLFQFGFGPEGTDELICTVSIFRENGTTICSLRQEGIRTDEKSKIYYHLGCMGGWTFYLTNLKSILEGGIDLRNKNQELKAMLNS